MAIGISRGSQSELFKSKCSCQVRKRASEIKRKKEKERESQRKNERHRKIDIHRDIETENKGREKVNNKIAWL